MSVRLYGKRELMTLFNKVQFLSNTAINPFMREAVII